MYIPFSKPTITGNEISYIKKLVESGQINSDGIFTKQCVAWIEKNTGCKRALLTTSCTHALEMCALLADIIPGDEVIMPSYTFVSTANAFALRGAQIVFVDIRPDTMNINEELIEAAITAKTKAIVPMHYAGIACEMDTIMAMANQYKVLVIEDAANSFMCSYKNQYLGSIGQLGCYSFDEAKNITCGEGGTLLINEDYLIEQAEVIRDNGTNRAKFLRGEIDKYSWQGIGSSYSPAEFISAYLMAQLEKAQKITENRLESWNHYYRELEPIEQKGLIELPSVPTHCQHNGHIFYLKLKDDLMRKELIHYLKKREIQATSHYIPLHSSRGGVKHGRFYGIDRWTTKESERLLRLPIYHNISKEEIDYVICAIFDFFKEQGRQCSP